MNIATTAALAAAAVSAHTAAADLVEFNFPINTDQEVPAPTVGSFNPSGTGNVTLDTDSLLLTWEINYMGLTGEIVQPGAHLHGPADFGATAGLQVDLAGDNAGTGTGATLPQPASGTLSGSFTLSQQQADEVLAGLWYVNIHTAQNPAGEIRGQIVPAPTPAALLAMPALALTRRRR